MNKWIKETEKAYAGLDLSSSEAGPDPFLLVMTELNELLRNHYEKSTRTNEQVV